MLGRAIIATVALSAMLVIALAAGCAAGAPAATPAPTLEPTTHYSNSTYRIAATLPGTGWVQTRRDNGTTDYLVQGPGPGSTILFVSGAKASGQPLNTGSPEYKMISGFSDLFSPNVNAVQSSFHGYSALKIEGQRSAQSQSGEGDIPPGYHALAYAFEPRSDVAVLIAVAGKQAEWENGGKDVARRILDSVEVLK